MECDGTRSNTAADAQENARAPLEADDVEAFEELSRVTGMVALLNESSAEPPLSPAAVGRRPTRLNISWSERGRASVGLLEDERHGPNGRERSDRCLTVTDAERRVVLAHGFRSGLAAGCNANAAIASLRDSRYRRVVDITRNRCFCASHKKRRSRAVGVAYRRCIPARSAGARRGKRREGARRCGASPAHRNDTARRSSQGPVERLPRRVAT